MAHASPLPKGEFHDAVDVLVIEDCVRFKHGCHLLHDHNALGESRST